MRVLFLAGRERTYARNEVLLRALRRFAEVDVVAPAAEEEVAPAEGEAAGAAAAEPEVIAKGKGEEAAGEGAAADDKKGAE